MNFKRFNGSTWETVQHKIYGSGTDSLTAFPAVIQASGDPLTDYTISGNTVQNGTPTPEAPVDVVGCGVRTGNLFDKNTTVYNAYIETDSTWKIAPDNSKSIKIPVSSNTRYTLSVSKPLTIFRICETSIDEPEPSQSGVLLSEIVSGTNINQYTFTTASDTKFIVFQGNGSVLDVWLNSLILNLGSTALPYEPYGYKIPLICRGETNNIYLGQVPTTRKIKKLVLTGEENWSGSSKFRIGLSGQIGTIAPICTHYRGTTTASYGDLADGRVTVNGGIGLTLAINDIVNQSSLAAWKSYLAAQYAAGTPVTVWYVLAEPETGIVNEPMHKIGNYADTISFAQAGVTIPTSDGDSTITFGTTVKPSAMSATFKGWHPVQAAKVYDGNDWR